MNAPPLSLDALNAICSTEPRRPRLLAPFALDIAGERWTVGTDGARLLAVRHDYGVSADAGEMAPGIRKFHEEAHAAGVRIDSAPLREFFAAHAPPPLGTCEACNGKEEEDCEECEGLGEIDCECLDCGNDHTKKCRACNGTGGWKCARCSTRVPWVKVAIGSAVYDARRIGPVFPFLPAGEVLFRQQGAQRMTTLAGADWFACLMPMRADVTVDVPRLHLPELAAA